VSSSWALTTFSAEKPKIKKKNGKQTKVFSKIDTVETFEEGIEGTVSMMSASIKLIFSQNTGLAQLVKTFQLLSEIERVTDFKKDLFIVPFFSVSECCVSKYFA